MRAWLSLVGMPKAHAATPHTTMATMAALSATRAAWLSPPKSTMPEMVSATAVETATDPARPRKLQATLRAMAPSKVMDLVPTASAMALAASVAPLTKIVAPTRTMESRSSGFVVRAAANSDRLGMVAPLAMADEGST